MSLLWKNASGHHPWGEPTEDYVRETARGYLRQHYDEEHPDDPGVHDHYVPLPHLGPDAATMEQAPRWCPSAEECGSRYTKQMVREIAQNNWTVEHRKLLDPEDHERRVQEGRERMNEFAWNLNAEHPGRVKVVDMESGEEDPHDADPRVQGY